MIAPSLLTRHTLTYIIGTTVTQESQFQPDKRPGPSLVLEEAPVLSPLHEIIREAHVVLYSLPGFHVLLCMYFLSFSSLKKLGETKNLILFSDRTQRPERENNQSHIMATSHVDVPGEPTETGTALLETATGAIQGFQPINSIHQHLCAFHFYADDMTRQVEAHHFCAHVNEDVRQCLIYDSPEKDARLIGIEYLVSESVFLTLPDDEKPLWHSHEFEVKGGYLFMPGVPGAVARVDLAKVCKTYGKTIHFWQVDRGDPLPLGIPQIMMSLTRDGQLHEDLAKEVEKKFAVSFEKQRENRKDMTGPDHGIHPLANAAGKGLKTELREVDIPPATSMPRIFV